MQLIVLIIELVILFFLSQGLTQSLFLLYALFFRSKKVAVTIITLLVFPGTVIHELSHLFTAEILGVHTGKIDLVPEFIDKDSLKTGSVAIAQTGPFRKALIGLAPVGAGLIALTAIAYFLSTTWPQVMIDWQNGVMFSQFALYLLLILLYLVFAISNSMFSSPQDLKGTLPVAILIVLLLAGAWFAGFRLTITGAALNVLNSILTALVQSIGLVLGVNLVLYLLSIILVRALLKHRGLKLQK